MVWFNSNEPNLSDMLAERGISVNLYYLAFLIEHHWIHNPDSLDWSELMLKVAKLGHGKAKRFWSYRTLVSRNGNYNSAPSFDEQELALSYIREAASEHCTYQILLSRLYADGHLVEEDHETAERNLKLAAKNGESIAQYQYANVCFNNGEIDKANDLILLSGQSGYKPELSKVLRNNDISYEDRLEADSYWFLLIDLPLVPDHNHSIVSKWNLYSRTSSI